MIVLGTSLLKSRRIQPPPFLQQRYRRGGSLCFRRTGGPIQRFFRVSVDGWIVDAHRGDGQRFVVHADEKLTAFFELELVTRR